jgi:hypothetical protein
VQGKPDQNRACAPYHAISGVTFTASQKKPLALAVPRPILPLPAITHLLMRRVIKAMIFKSLVISGHSSTSFASNLTKMGNLSPFRAMNGQAIPGLGGDRNIYFRMKAEPSGGHRMRW